jgi:NADH:ubiquinone reductase (H+-translocating)
MIISEMDTTPQRKPQVVIVGGGFGGIRTARRLSVHSGLDVTLISAEDTFAYYPQLYHAATGGVRSEASIPLTDLIDGRKVKIVRDTITSLDPDVRTISSATTTYHYDYLVLALGNVTNYFGIKGLEEFSYNIKTIAGAERFKKHLHDELLDKIPDLNYVVVGGGPTGVELAAALGDYLRRITKRHGIEKPQYNLELIEAAPRILPRLPEAYSARVHKRLEQLGVKVMTNATVEAETAEALQLKGESITSRTVAWTAGVSNSPFFKANAAHFTLAKNGKVEVNDHLLGRPGIYVIGDNAATQYSGMAQTAVYDADYVASDILHTSRDQPHLPYKPKAPISVIPVGEWWAATQWGRFSLYGFPSYLLRRAADLIAYADVESWPKAIKVWLQDWRYEDNCNICSPGEPQTAKPSN